MKIPPLTFASMAALALLLQGCASVSVASEDRDMVVVQNSGAFLFYCLPICSGDPDYPNQEVCNWFENTVKVETNIRLLEAEVAKRGATGYRNLVSHIDDEVAVPLILKRKIYKTSAEIVR